MDYLVFDIKGGRMIDFHSHVLPGIDDGSDCVEESLEMLHTAKNQGVSTMLATHIFMLKMFQWIIFSKRGRKPMTH